MGAGGGDEPEGMFAIVGGGAGIDETQGGEQVAEFGVGDQRERDVAETLTERTDERQEEDRVAEGGLMDESDAGQACGPRKGTSGAKANIRYCKQRALSTRRGTGDYQNAMRRERKPPEGRGFCFAGCLRGGIFR